MLHGFREPEHIDGACKLDPTDLLSETLGNDYDPKHVHIVVQVPGEGEYHSANRKAQIHDWVGASASLDGLSQTLANVTLFGPNDERKKFIRQSQKGR